VERQEEPCFETLAAELRELTRRRRQTPSELLLREGAMSDKPLVIDASIAVKWVVGEDGSDEALALLRTARLSAPDLLAAECANIL